MDEVKVEEDFLRKAIGIILLVVAGLGILYWLWKNVVRNIVTKADKTDTDGCIYPLTWNPKVASALLSDAMFGGGSPSDWNPYGWGTDEDQIFDTLKGLTECELKDLYNVYNEQHKRNLLKDFQSELGGDALAKAMNYFQFAM